MTDKDVLVDMAGLLGTAEVAPEPRMMSLSAARAYVEKRMAKADEANYQSREELARCYEWEDRLDALFKRVPVETPNAL